MMIAILHEYYRLGYYIGKEAREVISNRRADARPIRYNAHSFASSKSDKSDWIHYKLRRVKEV